MGNAKRLIVVGGGAAGFFAALRAKAVAPALGVTILESAPRCLGKVKISGGGRCNVTHACPDTARLVQFYPRGERELKSVFSRFSCPDTMTWFESRGVSLKTEADGRVFPVSNDSQTIIDCLMQEAQRLNVRIKTKSPVTSIEKTSHGFRVYTSEQVQEADFLLLSTGGSAIGHRWVQQFGHTLIPPVPSLFTFCCSDPIIEGLAGISFPHSRIRLDVAGNKPLTQEGPLLITHWGLSGPAVLKLSAWGARLLHESEYQATLGIDFFPTLDQDTLRSRFLQQKERSPKKHLENECPVDLPRRFWQRLLEVQEVPPQQIWADVPHKTLNRLIELLKRYPLQVKGKGVFKEEFVTAGGVPLKEIRMDTMESKLTEGLYFAGEILDVDGLTGGFNFQNAWSTGWIAGESIAARM